jgi:hypothetical protein
LVALRLLQRLDKSRSRKSGVITFKANFKVASPWAQTCHSLRLPRRSGQGRI